MKYICKMLNCNIFNQLVISLIIANSYVQFVTTAKNDVINHIDAVAGEPVYLPCDISSPEENDDVVLVLWYRENLGAPIYSVDGRERGFKLAERWSDEKVFSNRAYFMADKHPAELGVDHIRQSDEAIYRCRVDFKIAQTRNSKINLTIIVPPEKIVLTNDVGLELKSVIGPLLENDSFVINCDIFGGKPQPTVKWFRNNTAVGSSNEYLSSQTKNGNVIYLRNRLTVTNLSRRDLLTEFTCQAHNNNHTMPLSATLHLDMNFAPLNVQIINKKQSLSANRKYELLCQSSGSRPAALITWWNNGKRIDNAKDTVFQEGNTTTSTLSFLPTRNDDGHTLVCRSENHLTPSIKYLEDSWLLKIHYTPHPRIILGSSLDPDKIREGNDVYFDCIIDAYPNAYRVEWKHNGRILNHNIGQGIIITNQSLVLQGISRNSAGNYSCVGHNVVGDGESKYFHLNVLYLPFCKSHQIRIYGIAKHENALITCQVESNPDILSYKWYFNNSMESIEVNSRNYSKFGSSNSVIYTPKTELDYGTLFCWATNPIGQQIVPCLYHIIAAGQPDHVHNCTLSNISMTSLSIECLEGFNGGLPQLFFLEIYERNDHHNVKLNLSSPVPRFIANGLSPGLIYQLALFSYNNKGASDPFLMQATTLRLPEKHLIAKKDTPKLSLKFTSMIHMIIATITAIIIVFLLILIALRIRCYRSKRITSKTIATDPDRRSNCNHQISSFSVTDSTNKIDLSPSSKQDSYLEYDNGDNDDRNPDLIPQPTDGSFNENYCTLQTRRQLVSTIDQNYMETSIPICYQYYGPNCTFTNCPTSSSDVNDYNLPPKQWLPCNPGLQSVKSNVTNTSSAIDRHKYDPNTFTLQPLIILDNFRDQTNHKKESTV